MEFRIGVEFAQTPNAAEIMKFFRVHRDMLRDRRVDVHAANGILDALSTALARALVALVCCCRRRHSARPASMKQCSGCLVCRCTGRARSSEQDFEYPRSVVQIGGRDDMNFLHLLIPPPKPADGATLRDIAIASCRERG